MEQQRTLSNIKLLQFTGDVANYKTPKTFSYEAIKTKYKAFLEIFVKVLNFLRRIETVVVLVNILVLVVIVPWQGSITRHHEEVYATYKSIKDSLTFLRINNEDTYDLCKNSKNFSSKEFKRRLIALRDERARLSTNVVVSGLGMEQFFNEKSYQEIKYFIQWNDHLNDTYLEVCSKDLKNRDELRVWQKQVLFEMRKSL